MGKQAAAIGRQLLKTIGSAAKMLTLEIDRNCRHATPVDTGHARANWVPSVGQPFTGEAVRTNVGGNIGSSAHAAGVAEVLAYVLDQGPLWVANPVDYVVFLNYGSSEQRAAGWIELAVDEALQTVQTKFDGKIDIAGFRSAFQSSVGARGAENLASAYSPFGDD